MRTTKILPQTTTKSLQELLKKMNSKTQYSQSVNTFESNMLLNLKTAKGSLTDSRYIAKPTDEI